MAIVFSLLCAIVYGSADFCGGLASRRTPTLGVVVVSQAIGFAVLLALIPIFGGAAVPNDWAWGAVCGIAGAAAIGLLYRGLAVGTMGVVSPITAGLAATVPIVYGVVVRGERPTSLAIAGIAAALAAVVCVSLSPADVATVTSENARRLPPGLPEALGAGVFFGIFFIALAQTRAEAGMVPLLSARLTSLAMLAAGAVLVGRARDLRVGRASLPLVAACGALDMSANVFYVLAAHSGMLAIVAVVSSLYPAATVALAALVLHERLARVQWAGAAIALAGVIAITAGK